MAARKKKSNRVEEWVGGLGSMPSYVAGEGEPYRPEVLVWMVVGGPVVGFATARPGEMLAQAATRLRDATLRPMAGPPRAPSCVRVASPELAAALRGALPPSVELVCAPTPEIDHMFEVMYEKMDEDALDDASYLSPGTSPDAVASFFHATARLFRARPWDIFPDDASLLSVTIEPLEVRDATLCVVGQLGEVLGFILFSSLDDYEAFREGAERLEDGEDATLPAHIALNFDRDAEVPPSLRKEIAEHGWEVAGPDACPWMVAVAEDQTMRPAIARELTIGEAISLALLEVLPDEPSLRAAWEEGEPFARTLRVKTHQGELEVSLRAPCVAGPREDSSPFDLIGQFAELTEDSDEIDRDARMALEQKLVLRFVESPEAKDLPEIQACHMVMDLAADHLGVTIATLGPAELREVIFELIPRKISIDASKAGWIIEENRAFFAFLKREFGLPQADACLRVLGGDAVKRLEAALSDRRTFGMAKSMVMAGREAGFDLDTREGIEAWMRSAVGKSLPAGIELPPGLVARPVDPAAARARKNKRKAARKARQKGR